MDPQVLREVGFTEELIAKGPQYRGTGCRACGDTGYKGRIALYEVMPLKDRLKEMVLQGSSAAELKQQMIQDGVLTLRAAAINKCLEGVTTVDEVLRCTVSDKN
jgi:type IV pilus assembly protein PilB